MGRVKLLIYLVIVLGLGFLFPSMAYGIDKTGPSLVSSAPANNAVNVKIDNRIIVKLSKPLKKGPGFLKISIATDKGIAVKHTDSISGNILNIKALNILNYNSNYIVNIPANALMDIKGGILNKAIVIKFRTMKSLNNKQEPPDRRSQPSTSSSAISLNTHAFYSGRTAYDDDVEKYMKTLDTVSFAWLDLKNDNGNVLLDGYNKDTDFHIPDDYSKPLAFCRDNKIPAQIAIFSDGDTAKGIMADNAMKEDLIKKIIDSLSMKVSDNESFEFSGVVIDFEGFKNDDTKQYFNDFLSELKSKLDPIGKKLYVAVNVRSYWPGYDYKEIFKYADKIILMAHDYEPSGNLTKGDVEKYLRYNSQDPIFTMAPVNKVKEALEDLISCINTPEDMKKIWLQISFGIAQWQFSADSPDSFENLDNNAVGNRVSPTYEMLESRLMNKDNIGVNITRGYIKELESPFITYYNLQTKTFNFILYEDSESVSAEVELAKLEGIDGISIWRLGNIPDENNAPDRNYQLNVWETLFKEIN